MRDFDDFNFKNKALLVLEGGISDVLVSVLSLKLILECSGVTQMAAFY